MFEINWLSQSLAAISSLVIGYLWYGVLFSKQWMKATGITEEQAKKNANPALNYGVALVLAFIITIGLKFLIIDIHKAFNSTSEYPFFHGMLHGSMISIVMGAIPVLITNSLFDMRNMSYMLINVGYWILTFAFMGGIIGLLA